MASNNSLLGKLFKEGELPKVEIDVTLTRESLMDIMAAAVIAAVVVALVSKFVISKI